MTRILRKHPRQGASEEPWRGSRGYELAAPSLSAKERNLASSATYVRTLEEAADLVERGYALRMGAHGKRASLISPKSLKVVR